MKHNVKKLSLKLDRDKFVSLDLFLLLNDRVHLKNGRSLYLNETGSIDVVSQDQNFIKRIFVDTLTFDRDLNLIVNDEKVATLDELIDRKILDLTDLHLKLTIKIKDSEGHEWTEDIGFASSIENAFYLLDDSDLPISNNDTIDEVILETKTVEDVMDWLKEMADLNEMFRVDLVGDGSDA